jgi:hypothetical protein
VTRKAAPVAVISVREWGRGPILQQGLLVRFREVRGRRNFDRGGASNYWSEWWVSRKKRSWACRGLRVLAAHDQARWDMGLVFVSDGLERPDARLGAVRRAVPVEGCFCKR